MVAASKLLILTSETNVCVVWCDNNVLSEESIAVLSVGLPDAATSSKLFHFFQNVNKPTLAICSDFRRDNFCVWYCIKATEQMISVNMANK